VPQLFVALGFWLTWSADTLWALITYGGVVAVTTLAVRLVGPGPDRAARSALAVVLVTSTLIELGSLLVVRLVVVQDPADGFAAGLRPDALYRVAHGAAAADPGHGALMLFLPERGAVSPGGATGRHCAVDAGHLGQEGADLGHRRQRGRRGRAVHRADGRPVGRRRASGGVGGRHA